MTELGGFIINGLMTNPTLSTESIVIFVHETTQKAVQNLKDKPSEEDVEIRPEMNLEVVDTRKSKLDAKYKIQEGAGQGASICKLEADPSQNQS